MKLKTRFSLLMAVILLGFAAAAWLFSQHLLSRINEQWAAQLAERQVQFDKHRTLLPLTREIALARQMAAEPALIEMALDERDPDVKRRAIEVLERYRHNFRDHSYFAAFARTGNYYFNDAANQFVSNQLRYTLSDRNPNDKWFFATLSGGKDYQVNLDPDVNLGVTKVWINVLIKRGTEILGVIGTGIDITEFLKETVDIAQPGIHNLFVDRDMAIQLYRDASLIDYASITKDVKQRSKVDILLKDGADVENLRQVMSRLENSGEKIATLSVDFNGEKHLLGVAYLPELGWFDLTLMNTKKLSLFGEMALVPFLFGLLFLLALLAVGMVLRHWVLAPVARLQNAMGEIRQGNYDARPPLVGSGEMLQLSLEFRSMVEFVRDANLALEEKVRQRTVLLQTILDNAPLGIWMVDAAGRVQFVNKTFCNATGITEQQFMQAKCYVDVLPPAVGASCRRSDQEAASQAEGLHFSMEWLPFADGKDHLLEITKVKLLKPDGSVKGVLGLAADVTERRQAEEHALASELQYRLMADHSLDILWRWNIGQRRFAYASPAVERLCGYAPEEFIGQPLENILDPESLALFNANVSHVESHARLWNSSLELVIRCKNGALLWTEAIVSLIFDEKGKPLELAGISRDISLKRRAEEEQKHFIAMVSHEFRTPLAIIGATAERLALRHDGAGDDESASYAKIQRSVEWLTALLDEYLTEERLELLGHGLNPAPVSPSELLENVAGKAREISHLHTISVDASGLPETFVLDPDLINLALHVLAENAVKYTPPGTLISLQGGTSAQSGIEFIISDNGPGIPEDEAPLIFDKFFRGRQSGQTYGSGLGLFLARNVVKMHGGEIVAANRPGGGAEFRLWLPAVKEM